VCCNIIQNFRSCAILLVVCGVVWLMVWLVGEWLRGVVTVVVVDWCVVHRCVVHGLVVHWFLMLWFVVHRFAGVVLGFRLVMAVLISMIPLMRRWRVDGLALVRDGGLVAVQLIRRVRHVLHAPIGQRHAVRASHLGAVGGLAVAEVGAGVTVLDAVVERVRLVHIVVVIRVVGC